MFILRSERFCIFRFYYKATSQTLQAYKKDAPPTLICNKGTKQNVKCSCLIPFYHLFIIGFLPMPSHQSRPAFPQPRNLSPALPHGTHHSRQPSKPRVLPSPLSIPFHVSHFLIEFPHQRSPVRRNFGDLAFAQGEELIPHIDTLLSSPGGNQTVWMMAFPFFGCLPCLVGRWLIGGMPSERSTNNLYFLVRSLSRKIVMT